jgi:type IV pilus assembly protein PilW
MRRARGFTLVELIIAIALSIMVAGALLSVFMSSKNAYQATSGTASYTDSGRIALDILQQAIRSAGFMACSTTQRQITILNPPGASPLYLNIGAATPGPPTAQPYPGALAGYEAANTAPGNTLVLPPRPVIADTTVGDWKSPDAIAGLDVALAGAPFPPVKGSDILVTNYALPQSQPIYITNYTSGSNTITVNSAGALQAGQIAVVSDCKSSVSFQVTGAGGTTVSFGGGLNSAGALPIAPEAGAEIMPVTTRVFYVGVGSDGDGALYAYDTQGTAAFTAQELVPDVEAMQILYGIDSAPPTYTTNQYVTADKVTQAFVATSPGQATWNNVLSVKVALLVASPLGAVQPPTVAPSYTLLGTTVTAPIDSRSRQVFELTVSARNAVTGN